MHVLIHLELHTNESISFLVYLRSGGPRFVGLHYACL